MNLENRVLLLEEKVKVLESELDESKEVINDLCKDVEKLKELINP